MTFWASQELLRGCQSPISRSTCANRRPHPDVDRGETTPQFCFQAARNAFCIVRRSNKLYSCVRRISRRWSSPCPRAKITTWRESGRSSRCRRRRISRHVGAGARPGTVGCTATRFKINWKFDRRSARRKFGYKGKYFKRSENWKCEIHSEHVEVTWPKSIWRSPPARAAGV